MTTSATRAGAFTCLAILCVAGLGACSQALHLDSRWRDRELVIDGADNDWGQRRYILEETPITIGVMNDVDHLYLTMMTADRALQMQVATRGLELWLDPDGGRKSAFGLRLPGVMQGPRHDDSPFDGMAPWEEDGVWGDASETDRRMGGRRPRGAGDRNSIDPRRLEQMFEHLRGSRIWILDAPNDVGRETAATVADAIQVSMAYDAGRLVYEARLPLAYLGEPPYAIEFTEDVRVGLCLKIADLITGAGAGAGDMMRQHDGRMGGRAAGPGMGGPAGVDGRMRGRRPSSAGDAFEQWARVLLANAP